MLAMLNASFLLGLLLHLQDKSDKFLRNVGLLLPEQEDSTIHNHRSEKLKFYQSIRRHIPDYSGVNSYCRLIENVYSENMKT